MSSGSNFAGAERNYLSARYGESDEQPDWHQPLCGNALLDNQGAAGDVDLDRTHHARYRDRRHESDDRVDFVAAQSLRMNSASQTGTILPILVIARRESL